MLSLTLLWLQGASSKLTRHILAIFLSIEQDLGHQNRVELPEGIYTSKTLEVLQLISDFVIKIPPYGTCVKILHVLLRYAENSLAEKHFSDCPVLTNFVIKEVNLYGKHRR